MVDCHFLEVGLSGMLKLQKEDNASTGWAFHCPHYYIVTPTYITAGREALVPSAWLCWAYVKEHILFQTALFSSGPSVLRGTLTLALQSWPTLHPCLKNEKQLVGDTVFDAHLYSRIL